MEKGSWLYVDENDFDYSSCFIQSPAIIGPTIPRPKTPFTYHDFQSFTSIIDDITINSDKKLTPIH